MAAYRRRFGSAPSVVARAPGRVDVIGAHVDYNDGPILAAAIDRHIWVAAGAGGARTRIVAADLDAEVALQHAALDARLDAEGHPLPVWAFYPAGVAWSLIGAGLHVPPLHAAFAGDVPVGAGVSSSAAVETAFAHVWQAMGGWRMPPLDLAVLCRRAENQYVGVECGLMDQFASGLGRAGHALLLDCRSLEWDAIPISDSAALVLADTGTRRELSSGILNVRQSECQAALSELRRYRPSAAALRDVTVADMEALGQYLSEPLRHRAEHIVRECARVLATADALRRDDVAAAGALMDDSYESARDLYEASGPALDTMWQAGHEHSGCFGGRFIGAGFAGCIVFLVAAGRVDEFIADTARRYEQAHGDKGEMYATRAVAGVEAAVIS